MPTSSVQVSARRIGVNIRCLAAEDRPACLDPVVAPALFRAMFRLPVSVARSTQIVLLDRPSRGVGPSPNRWNEGVPVVTVA
jgi:hypothetical protein